MNAMPKSNRRLTAAALLVAGLLGAGMPARSGLLNIASDPLGTATTSIRPNVMFILDDSGSMSSDYMPDFVNDGHNPPSTTAACADAGDDSSANGAINGSPDACVFGDPPFNSPDFNSIYYNPNIFYRPGVNADGTERTNMNAASTSNWTAVPVNPYVSGSTTNLATGYPDRVWCTNQADAATSGNCRQNSSYEFPNFFFPFGLTTGGSVKYVSGAPYYYRMQSAQYCSPTTPTNCASGSSINLTVHTQISPEFCTDQELTNCAAGGNLTAAHVFSGVRWCSDSGTLVNCQRKKIGNFIHAKHLGTTQTITCPLGTFCNATSNEGNINVSAVNAAGGNIQAITIGGVSVIAGPIAVPPASTTGTVAALIQAAIQAYVSAPDFTAVQSGANVVVTQVVPGTAGSGAAIVVTADQLGTVASIGRLTVNTGPDNNPQEIVTLTVNGINLLCPIAATDSSFGNGVSVVAPDGRIRAGSGTNSSSERTSFRNALVNRINTCARVIPPGYTVTASVSGSDVRLTAPVSAGASPNGHAVARTGTGSLANFVTGNMGSVQAGASTPVVTTTTSNMSGGRDPIAPGTVLTVRKGVGAFSRTDIVPSNNAYPKGTNRTDCSGATCTYAEEMTNFANWYAYYRTRMQMMKTAVGRAFLPIDDTYRVGFITICPVAASCSCSSTANTLGQSIVSSKYLKIDDFDQSHKANWYSKLYSTVPAGCTPLREALSRVGLIYAGVFGGGLTTGLSAANDDPVIASCQPNFAILSTDGYWNGGPGRQLDNATTVGNQDNTNTGPYSLRSDGVYDGGLAGSTDTLADVALYYYGGKDGSVDLRASGPYATDNVPTTNKDQNAKQHMVTFTLGLGLDGALSYRNDYESATSGDFFDIKQGSKNWPVPVADSPTALDDLWHAAVNGRGVFFSAKNPEELADGLSDTLRQLQARVGAGAAAATSNLQPVAGDNFAFTAQYQTADWIGDLKARTIDLATLAVSNVELWSAASLLDSTVYSNRVIYTYDPADTGGNKLKHFCWPGTGGATCSDGAGLDATEQTYFNTNQLIQYPSWTAAQRATATARSLVDYLRGDTSLEDTGQSLTTDLYRERTSILGDLVNAQPAYIRKATFNYSDTGYTGFKACTSGTGTGCNAALFPDPANPRRGTVYAAANDGMLHAFETDVNNNPYYQTAGVATTQIGDDAFTGDNTGNGVERWAYIPRILMSKLHNLANKPYTHRYFADGSPRIGDICLSTPCAGQDDWRTILVAGLNSGGIGYYALDITNPLAPKALWEFTNAGVCYSDAEIAALDKTSDCNLGLTYGLPIITKRSSDGKWVVLVTSGYNNNVSGGDGKGYLYILDAATGVILKRIGTGVGSAASPSGLAKISGWTDNGTVDNTTKAVYGGDLEGNLWRFQLDSSAPGYETATRIATVVDSLGNPQPITVRPELGEYQFKRIILFGTGKFLETADKTGPFTTQTIYALRDDPTVTGAGPVIPNVRDPAAVRVRTFAAYNPATDTTRTITSATAPNWTTEWGWLIDLPDTGERVNVDPILQLGTLVIPSNVPTADTCTAGGYAWVNFLDYATGSYVPGATADAASSKIGYGLVVGINVVMGPGGNVGTIVQPTVPQPETLPTPVAPTTFTGRRVSWRELIVDQ